MEEERVDVGFESVRRINRFKDDLDPKVSVNLCAGDERGVEVVV